MDRLFWHLEHLRTRRSDDTMVQSTDTQEQVVVVVYVARETD